MFIGREIRIARHWSTTSCVVISKTCEHTDVSSNKLVLCVVNCRVYMSTRSYSRLLQSTNGPLIAVKHLY